MSNQDEMFSIRNGRKVDAHLHDPILTGILPEAERELLLESYRSAVNEFGIDPKIAARAYGLEFPDNPLVAGLEALS